MGGKIVGVTTSATTGFNRGAMFGNSVGSESKELYYITGCAGDGIKAIGNGDSGSTNLTSANGNATSVNATSMNGKSTILNSNAAELKTSYPDVEDKWQVATMNTTYEHFWGSFNIGDVGTYHFPYINLDHLKAD